MSSDIPWDMHHEFMGLLDMEERVVAEESIMVVVDAEGPPSATPDELPQGHVGTHMDILQQVLAEDAIITDIGHQLEAKWPKRVMNSGQGSIGVLVFDKWGRHRSVAWAYLIQVLLLSQGYNAMVSQTAINLEGTCGQLCDVCRAPIHHSLMTKAIVKLSMVPPL
jgi:hypothetical protein